MKILVQGVTCRHGIMPTPPRAAIERDDTDLSRHIVIGVSHAVGLVRVNLASIGVHLFLLSVMTRSLDASLLLLTAALQ